MTESEAVEMLKAYYVCQQMQVKGLYENCNSNKCDNCDLRYKQGNNGERIESTKIAIQALEKQIPKIPIDKTKPDDGASSSHINRHIIVCPSCNGRLKLKSKGRYCDKCGQKLDWRGDNETD